MAKAERLDKLLTSTGRWSRSEARRLIDEGRVTAEGRVAASPAEKYDPEALSLTVDGETVRLRKYLYIMLNKPAGLLSATRDGRGKTVLDLLPESHRRRGLFPVGRLDKDTVGLLLLTDDGDLAHSLLSPKKHVDKRYLARLDGPLDEADRIAFAEGITLEDGLVCQSAALDILSSAPRESEALVTIREGKFHQVKRMFAVRGRQVVFLKRLSMGPLLLDASLAPGSWRELTAEEEKTLLCLRNGQKTQKIL